MAEETTLRTQHLYDGRIIKLDLLDVRLPDGKEAKRERIIHPGAVAIVAFDSDQKVLLVRQFRSAAQKTLVEIPAGTLNPGEDPHGCAERELQEETGYKPGTLEALGGIYSAPGYTSEFIYLFSATDLSESKLAHDDDEFIEVEHVPLAQALAMIESGEIADGKSVAGLMRVARRLGV
ncbi:MAG TPA: NUDIX hydrolase [Phototrophicaceae bacterium]|nr:NUDIX hydrolase [Phototrophicaceae bacterium]